MWIYFKLSITFIFSFVGDIAFRFLKYVQNESSEPLELPNLGLPPDISGVEEEDSLESEKTHVTVCDINQAMLDVGKKRAEDIGLRSGTIMQLLLELSAKDYK